MLALLDLDRRAVHERLGPLQALFVSCFRPGAEHGLAAALGLFADACALVDAEDGCAVGGGGGRLNGLQGLVGVDRGGGCAARGAGVDGGAWE